MKAKKWDILICLCLALILSVFVFEMRNITPVARIYPAVILGCCYLMLALVLILYLKQKRQGGLEKTGESAMDKRRAAYIAVYCLAIFLYVFLLDKLGYLLSTVLFGLYSLIYMKNKNKIVVVAFPIVTALCIYFIFAKFLFIKLPGGIFMN